MVSVEFVGYWKEHGDWADATNGAHPVIQGPVADLGETQVLEQVRGIMAHGYGRLEVLIRQGQITTINSQTTIVRAGK